MRKEAAFLAQRVAVLHYMFEIKKCVFDEMAQLVEVLVVGTLNGSVFLGRDETAFMPCPVACSRIASVS